jgi:hypothetical protein
MTPENVRRLILALVVGVLVAGVTVTTLINRSENASTRSRVTKVESPCLKYGPKSKLCQKSFEKALGTLTHPEACAVERKAGTLRAVRALAAGLEVTFTEPCAGARLAQERQRGDERAATSRQLDHGGGVGQQGTSPAGEAPAPHHGTTHPLAPHHPTSHPSPAPSPSPESNTPEGQSGSGSSSATSTETSTAPATEGSTAGTPSSPSLVEDAGSKLGEVVTGTGELIHKTTCGLAASLLCTQP